MVFVGEISSPENGLVFSSNDVLLKIGKQLIGNGTLYISEGSLSWKPVDRPEGISIPWKQISVHGISRIPTKSIYFAIDHVLNWQGVYVPGAQNGHVNPMDQQDDDEDDDEGNESDGDALTEMWLLPTDTNSVDIIFQSMAECQVLHPDSADSFSDESGEFMDDAGFDDNEVGQDDMRNLNLNDERFEDAD